MPWRWHLRPERNKLQKGAIVCLRQHPRGNEKFRPIVPETLKLFTASTKLSFSTRKGIDKKKMGEVKKQKAERQKKILQTLEKRPGMKMRAGKPNERNQIVDFRKYKVRIHGTILETATEGS